VENVLLFPFAEYWRFYAAFTAFILVMLALDLGVFHREAHEVSFKEAATWSAVWMTLAVAFAGVLYWYAGSTFPDDARLMAVWRGSTSPSAASSRSPGRSGSSCCWWAGASPPACWCRSGSRKRDT
jgi:tellurite resistance protein TerC